MKPRFERKLLRFFAILGSIFLLIDGVLLSNLVIQKSIYNFQQSDFYEELTYTPQISAKLEALEDIDKISPIIVLPAESFETIQSTIEFEITSSEKLKTDELSGYLLEEIQNESDYYDYKIVISGLVNGTNTPKLEFEDLSGNIASKDIKVEKKDVYIAWAYTDKLGKIWEDGDDLLAVVDKEYALPSTYAPSDLVYISDYGSWGIYAGMQLREIVMDDFVRMLDDAKAAGHNLFLLSTYRSYQTQVSTYNYWVNAVGQKEADRASARPGHSEHQLGTTIDFTSPEVKYGISSEFGDVPSGKWLSENAHKYGFVMSYPKGSEEITGYKYEPWHYRYVGKDLAVKIYNSGKVPGVHLKELYLGISN